MEAIMEEIVAECLKCGNTVTGKEVSEDKTLRVFCLHCGQPSMSKVEQLKLPV